MDANKTALLYSFVSTMPIFSTCDANGTKVIDCSGMALVYSHCKSIPLKVYKTDLCM